MAKKNADMEIKHSKKIEIPPQFVLILEGQEYSLSGIQDKKFKEIMKITEDQKKVSFRFYSSQPAHVIEKILKISDLFLKDVSHKIDLLIRELIKNSEKENATLIAKKAGLISDNKLHAPLRMMGKILREEFLSHTAGIPLLYEYPEMATIVHVYLKDNLLHFEIENSGKISVSTQNMIKKRIQLGRDLATFDLRQEFEMKHFNQIKNNIRGFFLSEYPETKLDGLWGKAFGVSFEKYWMESPYFMMIESGKYTSFYPYYSNAFGQLRDISKREELPDEEDFSAGMGYIQCSFVIESNRSLYGTYGRLMIPAVRSDKTVAGFVIGMPEIEIEIPKS